MIGKLEYLKETPSQTAGPYVHIGLIPHQAGFDIFERPFSPPYASHSREFVDGHGTNAWNRIEIGY
jgi:hypothetical protein